jgi:hypothetical protein
VHRPLSQHDQAVVSDAAKRACSLVASIRRSSTPCVAPRVGDDLDAAGDGLSEGDAALDLSRTVPTSAGLATRTLNGSQAVAMRPRNAAIAPMSFRGHADLAVDVEVEDGAVAVDLPRPGREPGGEVEHLRERLGRAEEAVGSTSTRLCAAAPV